MRTIGKQEIRERYGEAGDGHGSRAECRITLQTLEFRATVMGVSLTPSSHSTVNVGLVSGTTGSHLNIDGDQVVRCYSICSSPLKTDYVEITPKRTKNGYASDFLNERALPGLVVRASGPAGKFYFDEKVDKDIVLIAAGSGITPMIAMLRYLEERSPDVPVALIYCVRTSQDTSSFRTN